MKLNNKNKRKTILTLMQDGSFLVKTKKYDR